MEKQENIKIPLYDEAPLMGSVHMACLRERIANLQISPRSHSTLRHYPRECKALVGLDSAVAILGLMIDSYRRRAKIVDEWSEFNLDSEFYLMEEDAVLTLMASLKDRSPGAMGNIPAMASVCRMKADRYYLVCDGIAELDSFVATIAEIRKELREEAALKESATG
jgi:hypothetical protein